MNKNALIVDDSRLACKIMSNMLESINIQSVSVYSAEEALEYLKRKLPDIIFLDHSMPGMDGLETIKIIKDNPLTATVPVMMYTAKQGEVYVGEARALGAVDVLPKGLGKDHLSRALAKMGFIALDETDEYGQTESQDDIEIANHTDKAKEITEQHEKSDLQTFWQDHVEPFLYSQKIQQSDEIQYSSSQLGLKLNRGIHQTLEQFEHVLISRIEAHDDVKSANNDIKNKKIKKLIYSVGILLLIIQLGLFWKLYKGNQLNETLVDAIAEQENREQRISSQLSELGQKLATIEAKSATIYELAVEESTPLVSLINDFGETVAQNLHLADKLTGEYSGVTPSGYKFAVDTQGNLGMPIKNRYFSSNDCSGEAFVDSDTAIIYRGDEGAIWYVDKLALPVAVTVDSTLNGAGECFEGNSDVLALRPLSKSDYLETGIDETQILSLYFEDN